MATNPGGAPETGSEQGDPNKPKSGQEIPSPNDREIGSKTCASGMEELYLCDSKTEETTLASSPCVSDSLHPHMNTQFLKKAEENLLQAKLLSLNLSKEDINFILEQGDRFLEKPPLLLARKLGIDVDTAKLSIEALKSFKSEKPTSYISEDVQKRIEVCLKDNPEFSTPDDIALLTDLPSQTVALYLQNKPLDDEPLDDEPLNDKPIDDEPLDDIHLDDIPIDDEPLDDIPLDDIHLDDIPLDDIPLDDIPLDENKKKKKAIMIGATIAGVGIAGGAIAGAVLCAIAAPFMLPAIGFTAAGVAAGSIAAAAQGPAVVAGSAFAIAQSVGATVTVAGAMGVGAAAGGVAGGTAGAVVGGVVAKKKIENED